MFMTKNKWLWEALAALALATLNVWMLDHLAGRGPIRLMLAQAWSGMLVVCALAYVAGVLPRQFGVETTAHDDSLATSRGQAWLRITIWTGCCASAWLTLPAGGSLGLMAAVIFFTLVWMNGPVDLPKSAFRTGFAIAITVVILLLVLAILDRPWRLARIIADFSGPLDLQGRHYFHGLILKVLFSLREFTNLADSFPAHLSKTSGLELLKFASWAGTLPAAFLAALILVGWHRLYLWLHATTSGAVLPAQLRRLGLALVVMHAATSLLNILWNFGISRQAFGASQPPLTWNVAWWILSASLVWVLFRAYGQHKLNSADTERGAKQKPWHALAGSAGMATSVVIALVVSVNAAKDEYLAMAPTVNQKYSRLDIVDRDGKIIAETVTAFDLWLIPHEFWGISPANPGREKPTISKVDSDEERQSRLLNALAEWPQIQSIVAANITKYGKSTTTPKSLAWAIQPAVAKKVSDLGLNGLRLVERPTRHYPMGSMYAHAIGFTSLSDPSRGQEGLELVANERMRTFESRQGPAGKPLATALDSEIQMAVNQALQKGVAAYGAIGAAAIVVDAKTGEIRAMASAPSFDPENRATYRNPFQPERIQNRAVAVNFPAGSLLTPLLVAHSMETGRIQPTTMVNMSNGQIKIGQTQIFDSSPIDSLSISDIIVKSSNVGQAKIAMQLPLAELKDVAKSMGVGEPLGIPGLIGGVDFEHIDWDEWTPDMLAQPGMHIQTNLMQAVKAYLPIANGGELIPLSLLAEKLNPSTFPRVLSPQTALSVREMLEHAASPTGTAPLARVTGIRVAGKSSTISDVRQGSSRYVGEKLPGNTISAFIGMAPTEKPQFLVGVMFQLPQGKVRFGGETAAPVFAEIIRQILDTNPGSTTVNQTTTKPSV